MRIGDDRVIPVDVRILAASNKILKNKVNEGDFRDDLYWRINILHLTIPPLRKRKDDIIVLFKYFLSKYKQDNIDPDVSSVSFLKNYSWLGNIRELKNLCERISVRCGKNPVKLNDIIYLLAPDESSYSGSSTEKSIIIDAIRQADGNKTAASEILGMHRTTLWRKLKEYNIKQ